MPNTYPLDHDDQSLLEAGFPEEHLAAARDAEGAFWAAVATGYPEMTTGDTQLSGEPRYAVGLWIAQHLNVTLDTSRLPLQDSVDNKTTRSKRFKAVLAQGLADAKAVLHSANIPAEDAPAHVREMLQGCAAHDLYWNLPSARDD